MAFIDTEKLEVLHKRPGWRGRLFHSSSNTFVWWEFDSVLVVKAGRALVVDHPLREGFEAR